MNVPSAAQPTTIVQGQDSQASAQTDNSYFALVAWYENKMRENQTVKQNRQTMGRVLMNPEPIDISSMVFDLNPLPLVTSSNDNHNEQDVEVIQTLDDALTIFGGKNDASLLEDLEPTPMVDDFHHSSSFEDHGNNKRKYFQQSRPAKKQRLLIAQNESTNGSSNSFRAYQAEQWTKKYEELCDYCKEFGNCQVPHTFVGNPALARWVKRQRYQYRLRTENKPSTMTDDRIAVLERIGFVWDSHVAAWDDRMAELLEYKEMYGHCNVPSNYTPNRQLAVWVKRQRRQYKFFLAKKPSSMTEKRIKALEDVGFEWELRVRGAK